MSTIDGSAKQKRSESSPPSERRTFTTFGLALAAVSISGTGWLMILPPVSFTNIAKVLTEVTLSFAPNSAAFDSGNLFTKLGRLLGLLTTLSGVFAVGMALGGKVLSRWWTRYGRKGHSIIVGQTQLTAKLEQLLRANGDYVVWNQPCTTVTDMSINSFTGTCDMQTLGFDRGKRIIIDLGSDARTIAFGRSVLDCLASRNPRRYPELVIRIKNAEFADLMFSGFNNLDSIKPRPRFFDENLVQARETLMRWPLYIIAKGALQTRVHALVVGFGDLGQKLFDQIHLTSLAGDLAEPLVTAVDCNAPAVERAFCAARPNVSHSLNLALLEFDFALQPTGAESRSPALKALFDRCRATPLTAIYVTMPSAEATVKTVIALRRLGKEHPEFSAAIFFKWLGSEGSPHALTDAWNAETPTRPVTPMSLSDKSLIEEVTTPDRSLGLAQQLHEAYRGLGTASSATDLPWDELAESYRRANAAAADHLPAKLWSLGLAANVTPEGMALSREDKQTLAELLSDPDSPQLAALARLEHGRWAIERKLAGWRQGEKRDDVRKVHTLLLQWEDLQKTPFEARKDAEAVAATLRFIADPLH